MQRYKYDEMPDDLAVALREIGTLSVIKLQQVRKLCRQSKYIKKLIRCKRAQSGMIKALHAENRELKRILLQYGERVPGPTSLKKRN